MWPRRTNVNVQLCRVSYPETRRRWWAFPNCYLHETFFFHFFADNTIQIAYISDLYNTFIVQAHSISQES